MVVTLETNKARTKGIVLELIPSPACWEIPFTTPLLATTAGCPDHWPPASAPAAVTLWPSPAPKNDPGSTWKQRETANVRGVPSPNSPNIWFSGDPNPESTKSMEDHLEKSSNGRPKMSYNENNGVGPCSTMLLLYHELPLLRLKSENVEMMVGKQLTVCLEVMGSRTI